MKISSDLLEYVQNVAKTARLVNINSVIIEPGRVRGIDEISSVVLFQTENIPDLEAGSIGLNRIDVFLSRLELVKTRENFSVEVVQDPNNSFVRAFMMKGKGMKIDYRCANPAIVRAPKTIHDSIVANIPLDPEAISLLQKGAAAMAVETTAIVSDNRGVTFEIEDVNSDKFEHTWSEVIDTKFSHKYPVKTLVTLFKQVPEGEIEIGQKGILRINVNDLDIYVLPAA